MSILSKLKGKPERVKVGEIEFDMKPLKVEDLELLTKSKESGDYKVMIDILSKVLKDSIPDVTEEEIKSIGFNHLQELITKISKINGLDLEKK